MLLYEDYMVAVFNFRGEGEELERVRVELANGKENDPNLTCGFGSYLSGVPGECLGELGIVALPHGFALVIPFAA